MEKEEQETPQVPTWWQIIKQIVKEEIEKEKKRRNPKKVFKKR